LKGSYKLNYYISDLHFFHANIIKFCNRPFHSVEEMNTILIKNWNNKVSESDNIYILGDISWGTVEQTISVINQLKGNKFLIRGNHDHIIKYAEVSKLFNWIRDYIMIKDNGQKVVLFHYPINVWDCQFHGSIHLYGHVHNNYEQHSELLTLKNAYNVSVEMNDYEPKTLQEIIKRV